MQETLFPSLGQEDHPGEGNGNPLQCSWLESAMKRGGWWAIQSMGRKELARLSDLSTHALSTS